MTDSAKVAGVDRVRFFYIKSNFFRVVHMDGAIGGLTPRGLIHCAVYNERAAIPQVTEHPIDDNRLGPEEAVEGKKGLVREVEVDLLMTRPVAEELRDWLTARIEDYDKRVQELEAEK